jgi:beta-glucosidase
VESGNYDIVIGKNAHDVVLSQTVYVNGVKVLLDKINEMSSIEEVVAKPLGAEYWATIQPRFLEGLIKAGFVKEADIDNINLILSDRTTEENINASKGMFSLPISFVCDMIPGYTKDDLKTMIDDINKENWRTY